MTTKGCALVTVELPTWTEMRPVVALAGTATTSRDAVAESTVAAVPLIKTAFDAGVTLNPVPVSATSLPTGPLDGEK